MSPGWEDLVARVRGASTRLLGRDRLLEIGRASDLVQVTAALEDAWGPSSGMAAGMTPDQVELAIRRAGARHLATLVRWGLDRSPFLAPVFLDEDRRSVQSLVRGAAAGAPPAERLSGLVPTPDLPGRALEELARQQYVRGVAALLSAWGHPLGSGLIDIAREPAPDLLRLDVRTSTNYIACASAAVRRAPRGEATRRELAGFVSDIADLENATTALLLASQPVSVSPETLFLPEGRRVSRATFMAVAQVTDRAWARTLLRRAFGDSSLAEAFTDTRDLADSALMARTRAAMRHARLFPLGAAPVLAFVLRVRAEVRDLCRIIWRMAAGAPPSTRDLVSVV